MILVLILALVPLISCHSWVDELTVIDSRGIFTGNPGYSRNFVARNAPNFKDSLMVHLLPATDPLEARDIEDAQGISAKDFICRKSQKSPQQSEGFGRLKAAPGAMLAIRYQENGHVTLPKAQPGKASNRGDVLIFGTTQPKTDERFLDVFRSWTADGQGGDKRGRLLANQSFDDNRCYQVNGKEISQERQAKFPHDPTSIMGADIWCQNDIKLPVDLPMGKPYTLYWVWDWPTAPGVDPGLPKGKAEIYTSCMDIDIVASAQADNGKRELIQSGDLNRMAIPSYVSSLMQASPQSTVASGPPAQAKIANSGDQKSSTPQPAPFSIASNAPSELVVGLTPQEKAVLSMLGPSMISKLAAGLPQVFPTTTLVTTKYSTMMLTEPTRARKASVEVQEQPAVAYMTMPATMQMAPPIMSPTIPAGQIQQAKLRSIPPQVAQITTSKTRSLASPSSDIIVASSSSLSSAQLLSVFPQASALAAQYNPAASQDNLAPPLIALTPTKIIEMTAMPSFVTSRFSGTATPVSQKIGVPASPVSFNSTEPCNGRCRRLKRSRIIIDRPISMG